MEDSCRKAQLSMPNMWGKSVGYSRLQDTMCWGILNCGCVRRCVFRLRLDKRMWDCRLDVQGLSAVQCLEDTREETLSLCIGILGFGSM